MTTDKSGAAVVVDSVADAQAKLDAALKAVAAAKAHAKEAKAYAKHLATPEKAAELIAPKKCSGPGDCQHPVIAKGLCPSHYRQQNRGHELTELRPRRELVKLPMVIRITPETMALLERRVKSEVARSLYEATRQAVEAGVEIWAQEEEKVKAAKAEEKAAKKAAKPAA